MHVVKLHHYIRRELVTATDEEGNESTVYAFAKIV